MHKAGRDESITRPHKHVMHHCTTAGVVSSLDSALQSVMQRIADWLPSNKTTLKLPGQKVSLP
jgi:hypothetical protein